MLSWVLFIIYLLVLLGIGFYVQSKTKNVEDFAVAGRKVGFFAAMCTIVASEWGSGVIMGVSNDAYVFGISAYIFPVTLGLGLILLGLTLAKRYWNLDVITMPQYLSSRYSQRVEVLATLLMVFSLVLVTGSDVRAAGLIGQSFLGIPFVVSAVLFVIIFAVYTNIGGLWAVIYTDVFQLIIGAVGTLVLLFLALSRVGGVTELFAQLPAEMMDPRPFGDWVWAFDYLASVTFVMLAVPELIQRVWACKTEKAAKSSLLVGGVVYWLFGAASLLLGLCAVVLLPGLETAAVIPEMAIKLFPPFAAALLCISFLAAVMSTADTLILVCATMITEDLYKKLFKPDMSSEQSLKVARIAVFLTAFLSLFFALAVPRILGLVLYSLYVFIGVSMIFIMGLVWKKASEKAAFISLILTSICSAIWEFGGMAYQYRFTTGMMAFVVSLVSMLVFSYALPDKQQSIKA